MAGKVKVTAGGRVITVVAKDGRDADASAIAAEVIAAVSPSIPTPEQVAALVPAPRDGEDGADADEEEIIERLIPEVLKAVPTAEEVAALVKVPEPIPGAPGEPGRDGDEISPESVRDKLASLAGDERLSAKAIRDLPEWRGGGVSDFLNLTDTPASYSGQTGRSLRVNAGATGLEFYEPSSGGGAWGTITGTLSDQSDLQAALDAKLTLPNLTAGSVLFSNGSTIAQDNDFLFWHTGTRQLDVYGSLGSELVVNPGFTGSAAGWTLASGWAYAANAVSKTSNGTGTLSQSGLFQAGAEYTVSIVITSVTAGTLTPSIGGVGQASISASGTYTYRVVAAGSSAVVLTPSNTARLTVDSVSVRLLSGGSIRTGQFNAYGSHSNTQPGTTAMQRFDNAGGNTWTEYRFAGTLRSAVGANSSGGLDTYFSGGNGAAWHSGNAGLTSNSLVAYLIGAGFVHYGYGYFGGDVHAGSIAAPSSTLQSDGSLAARVERKTANFTADAAATKYIVDASAAACSGTPSNPCSSYSTEATCLARDAHGGCSWFAGNPCSTFNGDPSSCAGQPGCTVETASCSSFGDEGTCNSYTGCSWNNTPQDCSGFDESSCGSTSGCTVNRDYCYNYSDGGGDGSACSGVSGYGCNYDSGSGYCSDGVGDAGWFSSCSGTYDSYSCEGSYETGNCTGTYGAACTGTASCAGIDDSTSCGGESGCTWATAVTVTLPSILTCPGRDYWIYNASSSGADVIIQPAAGDTVDHTASYTLGAFKDFAHVTPLADLRQCSALSEGACAAQTGCSVTTATCSWDPGANTCSGNAACDGITEQSSCESTTYYSGCDGTYYASKNWYVIGR